MRYWPAPSGTSAPHLAGANAMKVREFSDAECDERSRMAIRLDLQRFLRLGDQGRRWPQE
jgi:hypothetical protein